MPNLVLGLTSSVALYKSCDLLRRLHRDGFSLRVVMTPNATKLISPQLFLSLGAEKIFSELFPEEFLEEDYHIPLSDWADGLLIAPCSAATLCKCAYGIADNFLTTFFLSLPHSRVLIAPAMHTQMWESSPVKEAVERLSSWGVRFVGPEKGALLSGEKGIGRFADLDEIVRNVSLLFGTDD